MNPDTAANPSNPTATAEASDGADEAEAATTPESEEIQTVPLKIGAWEGDAQIVDRKKRGENTTYSVALPMFKPETVIKDLVAAVNESAESKVLETAVLRDMVRPAAFEASSQAIDAEGNFDVDKYAKAFRDFFASPSRRQGGLRVADIEKRIAEIAPQVVILVAKYKEGNMTEEEENKFQNLMLELNQLNEAHEKKSRGGKKGKGKGKGKKEKTAETPAAPAAS